MSGKAIMHGSESPHRSEGAARDEIAVGDDPLHKALCWARIDHFTDGILSGTSSALDQIFIVVNGRMIGAVPVARVTSRTDTGPGSWCFDARRLSPTYFLEDRLKIEIQPERSSTVVLDRREIETSHLFPIDRLPQGQGTLEGYIDGSDGDACRGWVWDPTNKARRIKVQLFVDGVFRGLFEASRPRPDLHATGRGDGQYGFAIPLREFLAKAGAPMPSIRVVAGEPEFWDVPFAPHTRPRAHRWPTLARWRRGPATTRDFVAILTGTESFPKKVYVIEQVAQRMPDAFTADYVLLALEFLRVEMVKDAGHAAVGWRGRLMSWGRRHIISRQIRRLTDLADATAATQTLLRAQSPAGPHQSYPSPTIRHAPS